MNRQLQRRYFLREWQRRYFFLAMVINTHLVQASASILPQKIDLGFVVDTSQEMGVVNFNKAKDFIMKLLDNFSISPGTTRVGLYTIGDTVREHFHFKTHVNRECVLKAIKKVKFRDTDKTYDFQKVVTDSLEKLLMKGTEVANQRRIYLFISNSDEGIPELNENMRRTFFKDDVIGLVLVGDNLSKRTNKDRIEVLEYQKQEDILNILTKLKIEKKSYSKCDREGIVTDECNRQCECKNSELHNCYRIRQEFTAMTTEERRRYLKAYKTLTSVSPYKEVYERFIFMHYKYFCWGIHNQELFLPWHRWFISMMEDLLKQIDCRVTLSYWDWSLVSNDPWNRTKLWRSTDDGLGGNGNRYKGYCVQKGIFRESEWETPYWEDPMDIISSTTDQLNGNITDQRAHLAFCLRRAFKGLTPSAKSVQRTLNLEAKQFRDFDIQIRHNFHDRIHNIIGGTMCTHYAGDTPEFFLHHAFLDKIWYMWQSKSLKHKYVHFLQRNVTKMMGCKHTQLELIDSHDLPRCIKVKYTTFPRKERNKRDKDEIDDMTRTSYKYWDKYLQDSWFGTFPNCTRTKKEKQRAKYLHQVLDAP